MASERHTPWLKFYSADWRVDAPLRMCSYAARGLWVDMLTLMHEAQPYGHLLVSGMSPSAKDLAGLLGGTEREVTALLVQLEAKRVFSRTDEGVIYSRRMQRDAERAKQDRANGKRGGNPQVKPSNPRSPNPPDNGGVNPPDNPMPNPRDNGGVKAQRLEARGQNQKESKPAFSNTREPPPATPLMPTLNDPSEAWLHLGDSRERGDDGEMHACVGGWHLDVVAFLVCQAAGMNGHSRAVDWRPLVTWLRAGIDPHERIIPTIQRIAARPKYVAPDFLTYFDSAIREVKAA